MKELSIEEKAKCYDEAIEKAKKCLKDGTITDTAISYIETIFPELKESEDERIRKDIISYLKSSTATSPKTWIAWLEKQGEKKPQGKSALEAINEKKVDNANKVEARQEELTEFEKAIKQVMEEAIECGDTHNLKADADMLLRLAHKPAWSEEDEKMWAEISNLLWEGYKQSGSKFSWDDIRNWINPKLKSLRPQFTWKPSDEQMNTLEHYIHTLVCTKYKEILFGLYSDLKELRGE